MDGSYRIRMMNIYYFNICFYYIYFQWLLYLIIYSDERFHPKNCVWNINNKSPLFDKCGPLWRVPQNAGNGQISSLFGNK